MKNKFQVLLSNLRLKTGNAVIFVPNDRLKEHDGVRRIVNFIKLKAKLKGTILLIDKYVTHLNDALSRRKVKIVPKKVVLFAHPAPTQNGFEINCERNPKRKILLTWWQCENHRFSLIIAHVCRGKFILSRPQWKKIFPHWVSYSKDLHFFLSPDKGQKCWGKVSSEIIQCGYSSNSAIEAKEKMENIYNNAMLHLSDTQDNSKGDILNILYLQESIEAMVAYDE